MQRAESGVRRWSFGTLTLIAAGLLMALGAAAFVVAYVASDDDDNGSATGTIAVSDVWSRPAPLVSGGTNGVVYLTIENQGPEADRLVSASSPMASVVEMHRVNMDDGVMQMRPVEDGIEIPAGESIVLEPSGLHIMLVDLTEALEPGDQFEVTLMLDHAGEITVQSEVRDQ